MCSSDLFPSHDRRIEGWRVQLQQLFGGESDESVLLLIEEYYGKSLYSERADLGGQLFGEMFEQRELHSLGLLKESLGEVGEQHVTDHWERWRGMRRSR